MTMIQAVVSESRISVVADSICGSAGQILRGDDGRELEECKLIALPHAKCVLTSLGSLGLRQRVQCSPGAITSFDQGVRRLPELLARAYATLSLHLQEAEHPLGHSVLLMGWSAERKRMAIAHFHSRARFEPEVHGDPVNGGTVFWRCPDLPRVEYQLTPIDTPELLAYAHATSKHYRSIDPTTPIGGKLILAELTEQAVTISGAGDLGMPMRPATPTERIA